MDLRGQLGPPSAVLCVQVGRRSSRTCTCQASRFIVLASTPRVFPRRGRPSSGTCPPRRPDSGDNKLPANPLQSLHSVYSMYVVVPSPSDGTCPMSRLQDLYGSISNARLRHLSRGLWKSIQPPPSLSLSTLETRCSLMQFSSSPGACHFPVEPWHHVSSSQIRGHRRRWDNQSTGESSGRLPLGIKLS